MTLIRPFAGLRPRPEYAQAVIAPPYDVLNTTEARQRAVGRPYSFLHISKPEIDLSLDVDPYAEIVYAKGADNLQRLIQQGILQQDSQPCYYLYGLTMGNHHQIGLVAVASVADYNSQRIRKHELTRPEKEDDRVRHIDSLNAQTGPVFLTYKHHATIDELVKTLTTAPPAIKVVAEDGVVHTLWVIQAPEHLETLTSTFNQMDYLYIADGHHRSAAAARVAAIRQANNLDHTGAEAYNYFLSVIFPDHQTQILGYNRVVEDCNGLTHTALFKQLQSHFNIHSSLQPVKPQQSGEFGMYLSGRWYQLNIRLEQIPSDPVASLDVSLLTDYLLAPILGITDLRRDQRIDFVGGIRGLSELETRVDSGQMAIAFSLYPTTLPALMAVADAGKIMPPKSTWFEPKLADGMVTHLL